MTETVPGAQVAPAVPAGDPAERTPMGTPVDGVEVLGALSPSRASDFRSCPLQFRFRTIDRLPEPVSPAVGFEGQALFQMRFYALVIWRTRGVVPALLRLIYLGDGEMVSYVPDEADLLATERLVQALWEAIRTARETGDWRPSPGPRCAWCSFQQVCPAFGGTPPPLPVREEPPTESDIPAQTDAR